MSEGFTRLTQKLVYDHFMILSVVVAFNVMRTLPRNSIYHLDEDGAIGSFVLGIIGAEWTHGYAECVQPSWLYIGFGVDGSFHQIKENSLFIKRGLGTILIATGLYVYGLSCRRIKTGCSWSGFGRGDVGQWRP